MQTIEFSKPNMANGWLSLWSPHGIYYKGEYWKNCANAWYGTRYEQKPIIKNIGARIRSKYAKIADNREISNILLPLKEILLIKLEMHPILKDYLKDTGTTPIAYMVSNYATNENKWLGINRKHDRGPNMLGRLWMEIREELQCTI